MKFSVDPKIFEKFAGVEIGVLVITGMDNRGHNEEILKLLRSEEANQKKLLTGLELGSLPEVSVWRKIYQDFGSNKDYRSSVESLLRRARGGEKPLPQINNLVDLYNYISLKYHLPAGAEDLDKVEGDIGLTFAIGSEKGKYIGGELEDTCYQGEVIYKDKAGFICRRWNWRESDRTKIEFDTENSVLVIEKAPGLDEEKFKKALDEVSELVKKYLKGNFQTFILDQTTNSFKIVFKTARRNSRPSIQDRKAISMKQLNNEAMKLPSPLAALFRENMDSIAYRLRLIIFQSLEEVVDKGVLKLEDVKIEHPVNANYGDYSTNVAMVMAGRLKMKPIVLASKLTENLNKYIRQHQSTSSVTDSLTLADKQKSSEITKIDPKAVAQILEKAEVAGSGFINLWLRKDYLITSASSVLNRENGVRSSCFKGKKVMVEFAHPNTHKELHIGHMRTLVTGEALSRILSTTGTEVFRANYQGDIGPHVAKAIWGTEKLLTEKKITWDQADKLSLPEKAHLLGQGYVEGNKHYEEEESEIDGVNLKLYQKDPSIWPVYEKTRRWSLDYYDEFYRRFYSRFDKLYFESEVANCGKKIVLKNVGKVFKESDGAIVFPGEKYGLHTRVFVTKDGNPTYEGKDMCLAPRQFADFPFDKCIHVVANEQSGYFNVIIKALELIDPKFIGREYHLSMGMVNLIGRKISSRTGEVVTVDKLLDDVKALLKELIKEGSLSKQEIADILEKTTIGAVKYSVLKTGPQMNVAFDLEKSVSLEGDSGPYLMYTYARCKSVIRKSGKDTWKVALDDSFQVEEAVRPNPEELSLLRTFYRFPEVVTEAARTLSPNLICSFLFDLAQKYNLFYNKHSILNPALNTPRGWQAQVATQAMPVPSKVEGTPPMVEESVKTFRLFLTIATSAILKQGLYILGIETVERM